MDNTSLILLGVRCSIRGVGRSRSCVGDGAMADDFEQEFDSELILGLVCAVGAEKGLVIDLLKERLGRAGYTVQVVKVSKDVIPLLRPMTQETSGNYQRISDLMDAGNEARS